jgi:hypothetical protein
MGRGDQADGQPTVDGRGKSVPEPESPRQAAETPTEFSGTRDDRA